MLAINNNWWYVARRRWLKLLWSPGKNLIDKTYFEPAFLLCGIALSCFFFSLSLNSMGSPKLDLKGSAPGTLFAHSASQLRRSNDQSHTSDIPLCRKLFACIILFYSWMYTQTRRRSTDTKTQYFCALSVVRADLERVDGIPDSR